MTISGETGGQVPGPFPVHAHTLGAEATKAASQVPGQFQKLESKAPSFLPKCRG